MKVLETIALKKYYGKDENKIKAVEGIDLKIDQGEFVAIVGTSGSGKSTLLHMMGGLDQPTDGKVFIDDENIYDMNDENLTIFRRRKIGFVFQAYNLIPVLNVWENITLPTQLDLKVVNLLKLSVKKYHQTLVMVTHDEILAQMADGMIRIEDGVVVNKGGATC
ncbi:MAG: ABC transporter ATP-binding protein [Marinisporobacter sp.]|jgi:putative ABC transport system ATP-binding protein|nr:ABC transporter ATP-binding protein [Marinisporobacter sp.]